MATDNAEIEETVLAQSYKKTVIYHRSAENACDTASTESVMLEYIHQANLEENCIFMLVQATSPLTETHILQRHLLSILKVSLILCLLVCEATVSFGMKMVLV